MSDGDLAKLPQPLRGGLGRHQWHDPANRLWPARALLRPQAAPRAPVWWRRDVYDQGSESSCTAQAAAGLLASSPYRLAWSGSLPSVDEPAERYQLYRAAQRVDPWDGEEPAYYGSSTDAPFKVLRDRGLIAEWRWCFGLADVIDHLRQRGPVAVGTWWYGSMEHANERGLVDVSGVPRGGHAYDVLYHDDARNESVCVQSWGRGSPTPTGRFRLADDDLGGLLDDGGEAVTVVL